MLKPLFMYVLKLYNFVQAKLILDLFLTIGLGLLEGASIMMLLPLLTLAGITSNQTTGVGHLVEEYLNISGIALPLVLMVYIGINAGQAWLQSYESILNSSIRESFATYLYTNIYQTITYARWSFFLETKRADIIHVITTEMPKVITGAYQFLQMIITAMIAVIHVGIAFILAPYLTLLVLFCGLILSGCLQFTIRRTRKMSTTLSDCASLLFSEISEHFNGIKEIKSYGVEAQQVKNFENHWRKIGGVLVELAKLRSQSSFIYRVGAAVFISVFYFFAIEIFHSDPRELIIVFVIFTRLWPRFSSFQAGFQSLTMMLPAFQKVTDLNNRCKAETEQGDLHQRTEKFNLRTGIRVANVSFRYGASNQRYAVRKVNFFIPAGTTTAIVGVSGAGKSTLADLVLGLIEPEQGEIWIDDKRLAADSNRYLWRHSIGYVPQDAFLFNASIRDNLTWAYPAATEQDLWQALQLAAIDDFVKGLPNGLDSLVGDRGIRLSGGERQRIVLARALLRKPALLILDEATSSLDTENERRIQEAIDGLRGKLTILIVAHRISTIKNADQILVMEKGRIVERGRYQTFIEDEESRFYRLAAMS
ncbi:Heterocyst differentiation ATP-binding protein HepA [Sporomusa acidovorans DSM 3132]|uniref:Heterocyst differentiation ATP-binding protein HepA n=2 Tax=Sporomusa TaxID=2375 RepID=A0ABZ3IZL1_SPOA4|nr:ABC transporter ATP-binding protein [Sporomusa acidovorans]OZC17251.1 heterocyst differentiation ATP-binding protein HepA [Sporomusa acidovorans DSM 3132]SDF15770.1 ATP-binding cassette, subfamily C [Sporomusa acidovorans]